MTAPSGAVDSGEEIFLAPRGVALRSAYGLPTRNAAGPLASPASYTTSWDAPRAYDMMNACRSNTGGDVRRLLLRQGTGLGLAFEQIGPQFCREPRLALLRRLIPALVHFTSHRQQFPNDHRRGWPLAQPNQSG